MDNHAALYTLIGIGGGIVGSILTALINRRVPSADKKQDSLTTISTALWDENRKERTEAGEWQEKYYNIYINLQRMEKLATDYIKLQARYKAALLEQARLQALAQIKAETEDCGDK